MVNDVEPLEPEMLCELGVIISPPVSSTMFAEVQLLALEYETVTVTSEPIVALLDAEVVSVAEQDCAKATEANKAKKNKNPNKENRCVFIIRITSSYRNRP